MSTNDKTLQHVTAPPPSRMWTPGRPGGWSNLRLDALDAKLERLRRRVPVTNSSTTPAATAAQVGTPKQLISMAAYQTAYKSQNRTFSLVSISFTPTPGDINFAGCRIWFVNYLGDVNPQLMTDSTTSSPMTFLAEATQETVTVVAQPYSVGGQVAPYAHALTTTLALTGVTSAPPPPTVTQTLTAVPGGFQFVFAMESGLLADIVDSYKVYRNTLNTTSGATVVQTIKHPASNNGSYTVQDYPGGDTIEFYWVSAVNTQGMESTLAAAQSSTNQALSTAAVLGHNFCANPGFEVNNLGTLQTFVSTAPYPITDGWIVQNSSSGLFGIMNENANGRNNTHDLLMRIQGAKSVVNGTQYCRADSTVKMPVQSGDWVGWRVYQRADRSIVPPAGVSFTLQLGVAMYQANGTLVGYMLQTVTPTYDGVYRQRSSIQQMNTGSVAYITPFLQQYVGNTGTTQNTSTQLWSEIRWDDCFFFIQAVTDDATPQSAGYTPNTQPLTATISGSIATVHVAAFSVTYPFGTVSYNSGTVGGLVSSTKYYVTASDRGFGGGAVAYHASTSNPFVNSAEEYIYLGSIVTPASGGGTTSGSGGGGGICFTPNTRGGGAKRLHQTPHHDWVSVSRPDGQIVRRRVAWVHISQHSGPMYDIGGGQLVTPRHHFRRDGVWRPAEEIYTEIRQYTGPVYNLHIETDDDEEHNYVLADGSVAHNVQKI